ncbi:hypothetical protein A8A54_20830 [Brucella pseudogrignonensis]|nr:hypothetical protein A8A54_20830 [Brucella pseudogrignonensis]
MAAEPDRPGPDADRRGPNRVDPAALAPIALYGTGARHGERHPDCNDDQKRDVHMAFHAPFCSRICLAVHLHEGDLPSTTESGRP